MGQLNIPDNSVVYTDTSIIIYTIEKFPNYLPILEPIWDQLERGKIEVVSSDLTLMETLVVPLRNSDSLLINAFELMLLDGYIELIPISRYVLKEAAKLRSIINIKTPDAIHAATAISRNCTIFLTNDPGFRKVSDLPVIFLDDVLKT